MDFNGGGDFVQLQEKTNSAFHVLAKRLLLRGLFGEPASCSNIQCTLSIEKVLLFIANEARRQFHAKDDETILILLHIDEFQFIEEEVSLEYLKVNRYFQHSIGKSSFFSPRFRTC
jgi:hypothetical protein